MFTRHADVDTVLRDHRHFSNDPRKGTLSSRRLATLPPPDQYTLLFLDPPEHTRQRAPVNRAFTPKAVNAYESRIRGMVEALVDDVDDPAAFDFMRAVAWAPANDRPGCDAGCSGRRQGPVQFLGEAAPASAGTADGAGDRKAGEAALREFDAYFRPVIEKRRTAPGHDTLSGLVRARNEGAQLSDRETLNMLRLLLSAGTETTANLIGNGVLALLRHPDQLQRLREDPGLIPTAVEELLRFDSPVQADYRRVLADCEVNGVPLRRRDNIVLLLGAANRDPDVFENPDRLDVGRRPGPHLSFGRGIHRCPGAALARLQGRIVLEVLLERFSSMALIESRPRFRKGIISRGLQSLMLRCVRA